MKRYFYVIMMVAVVVWALSLNSCTKKSQDPMPEPVQGGRVEWNMSLDGSRAAVGSDGSGYFEAGDSIVVAARNLSDGAVRYFTLHLSERG